MPLDSRSDIRGRWALTILGFVLVVAVIFVPTYFRSNASTKKNQVSGTRTESHEAELPNYDIREDKKAAEKLVQFRANLKSAAQVADIRDGFVSGEQQLAKSVPTLKVEYNTDIRIPEVIAPDVKQGIHFLTASSGGRHTDTLFNFLRQNTELTGVASQQVDQLKVAADYTNPDGNLSFVELDQDINGIPVFRGEVKAGFTKRGEMIRVINNLAPGLDYSSLSSDFREPLDAVQAAARYINVDPVGLFLKQNSVASSDLRIVYGDGTSATTAEKMYFPTEPGVAVPAWRVLIYKPVQAYYVIVDAETGTMLWRKNLTEDQTQSATYNVYTNANNMINVGQSPFPLSPGPLDPSLGTQGSALNRTTISLIGNEAPATFNNLGWITDGNNTTDGNNVQAGLDRKLPNTGSPANPNDLDPDGMAVGNPSRTFNFPFTPGNPNTNSGDSPLPVGQSPATCLASTDASLPTDYQKAITTQLFYIVNRYHDALYQLGFNEPARNFQNTNFTGQGAGNDRVSAQSQDCSGTSNANFTTPADGSRPTMQMYLWPGPTPDFDGSLDADIVIHEHTHGLSNRLHGNASGLSTNMSRGMGEGWSDFYAHSLLANPTDPVNGIYTLSGYATYQITAGFTGNYYYGIRRYPKDVIAHTGGANNKPHNAYTFKHLNSNCNTFFNNTNFAFARGPVGSSTCDQVHNVGEVWSSALWEVRGRYVTRLGLVTGNRRMLQFVTDGMKLAPLGPTFLSERDAIIAAAGASGTADDVGDLWAGFALRGMGFSASIQNAGTGTNNTAVTEGFDPPNLAQTPNFTVSDATGDNDGFPEPGETVSITVPISNSTGTNATGVTVQIVGGGTANYGNIASGATVAQAISYTVPAGTPCGSFLTITINVNSSIGPTSFTRSFFVGAPGTLTATQNFDSVTAPALPAGWTATSVQSGVNFVTTTNNVDTAPNAAFAVDPTTVGGGTDLTAPVVSVNSATATVSFRNRYDTEAGWDGGVLEISLDNGPFQDITAAGGSFQQNGYNGVLGGGVNNPNAGRNAWTGNSGGYVTTVAQLPASANGKLIQLRWRFGADDNTSGAGPNPGWYVDSISLTGAGFVSSFVCSVAPSVRSRADFDGDGKTDLSVKRNSDGNWYALKSTGGVQITNWGLATDTIVPGDYDHDGKADAAVYRPSTGQWFILNSSNSTVSIVSFGVAGDVPVAGDYDGDGKTDEAIYRPSAGQWYAFQSSTNTTSITTWGNATDVPVQGDYDNDGKTDVAVYRASTGVWYIFRSTAGPQVVGWGIAGDKPVQADYDGDNKDDIAIYRPSTGVWYIFRSTDNGVGIVTWGNSTDVPVPGDYDGDGKDDEAVFRNGTWFVFQSTAGPLTATFGVTGDVPVPSKYIP